MLDAAPIAAVLDENSTINEPDDMTGADEIDLCKFSTEQKVRFCAVCGENWGPLFSKPKPRI